MGTDIHIAAELKKAGRWANIHPPKKKCWTCFGIDGELDRPAREDCWLCEGTGLYHPEPYEGRNYDLFAALANVRNGHGFAGIVTGTPIMPIAMPRGVPKDVTAKTKKIIGHGYHDFSWLLLQDLLEYDWDATMGKQGVLSEHVWREWADRGFQGNPLTWSGDVSGPNVIYMDENQLNFRRGMNVPCEEKQFTDGGVFIRCKWGSTIRDRVGPNWWETMFWLTQQGKPTDVRIVFSFDS